MNIEEERKKLVLARFRTFNQESKFFIGGKLIPVKELIKHLEVPGDDFGKEIVDVQMEMLKTLGDITEAIQG